MNTMSKTFTLKRFLMLGLLMGGLAFASTAAQAGGPHHHHGGGFGGGHGGGYGNGGHYGGHNHQGGYGGRGFSGGYGGGYRPGWGSGHNHFHDGPVRPYPVGGPVYYGVPAYRGNSIGFSNGNIGFIYNWR